MPSFDMLSFFMLSFFMPSFDMLSFVIAPLDMDSFFIPSSLPILSMAKAAGTRARLSDRAAADTPSAMRVVIVIGWSSLRNGFESDLCRYVHDGAAIPFVTRCLKLFRQVCVAAMSECAKLGLRTMRLET